MFSSLIFFTVITTSTFASPLEKRQFNGGATYYGPSGGVNEPGPFGIGSCENHPVNQDYYVAVGAGVYDASKCGTCIEVSYNGKTTVGPMADKCPSCGSGVDISLMMMGELLGGMENAKQVGRLTDVTWKYVSCPSGKGVSGGSSQPVSTPLATPVATPVATPKTEPKGETTENSKPESTPVAEQPKHVEEQETPKKDDHIFGSAPIIVGSSNFDKPKQNQIPTSTQVSIETQTPKDVTQPKSLENKQTENRRYGGKLFVDIPTTTTTSSSTATYWTASSFAFIVLLLL